MAPRIAEPAATLVVVIAAGGSAVRPELVLCLPSPEAGSRRWMAGSWQVPPAMPRGPKQGGPGADMQAIIARPFQSEGQAVGVGPHLATATSATRDIIVLGGSGGSLEALGTLVRNIGPEISGRIWRPPYSSSCTSGPRAIWRRSSPNPDRSRSGVRATFRTRRHAGLAWYCTRQRQCGTCATPTPRAASHRSSSMCMACWK